MAGEEQDWKANLKRDLDQIESRHTPESFPVARDAKRSFDSKLERTAGDYEKLLEEKSKDERKQLDRSFRDKAEHALVQEERSQWPHARTMEEKVAARLTISNRLDKLNGPDAPYRSTPEYQEQSQRLQDLQAQRQEGLNERIQDVREQLNERFGFPRDRGPERQTRDEPEDRER